MKIMVSRSFNVNASISRDVSKYWASPEGRWATCAKNRRVDRIRIRWRYQPGGLLPNLYFKRGSFQIPARCVSPPLVGAVRDCGDHQIICANGNAGLFQECTQSAVLVCRVVVEGEALISEKDFNLCRSSLLLAFSRCIEARFHHGANDYFAFAEGFELLPQDGFYR